jgi:hypothetical protein
MGVSTIQAGTVGGPHAIAPGVMVTVSPAVSASAFVEYTTNTLADIANGVAKWSPWPNGTVSAASSRVASKVGFLRVTASGGPVVLTTNFAPNNNDLAQFSTDWAMNSPIVLAQSAVPSSVTGTLTETTLASIVVPPNLVAPAGSLRIVTAWSYSNNSNAKSMRAYVGGTLFLGQSATTTSAAQWQTLVRNRGSRSSQFGYGPSAGGPFGATSAANVTASIDMSAQQTIAITGQLASASDTITLEGYTVEVLNP